MAALNSHYGFVPKGGGALITSHNIALRQSNSFHDLSFQEEKYK